ncbi:cathepsin S-like [Ambystoma mexicanum]|uniref:cathepsin S-like n=1 Tax=Ambystoma mexicanum TaxID=8296 RepID=UPI0037E971C6
MQLLPGVILLTSSLALSIASRHLDREWQMWKSRHERNYITEEEEELRRNAWEATWHKVQNHNLLADQGKKNFRLEMNHFADKTSIERKSIGCLKRPSSEEKPIEVRNLQTNVNIPKDVDWRKENCVTTPKNQGICGSCWAFATVGTLESRYCIKHKQLLNMSEQQLVDCDQNDEGCCGGFPRKALEYVSEHGIMKAEDYEYVEHSQMCAYKRKETIKMKMSKFYVLPEESNMAAAVALDGPLTVGFAVTDEFQLYNGEGIFDGECAEQANHAIIIVGYGTEDDEDYWIIKNSWGTDWADGGYGKVRRNVNHCAIGEEAATADILGPDEDIEE